MWLVCPRSSWSITASRHELGEHFIRQRGFSNGCWLFRSKHGSWRPVSCATDEKGRRRAAEEIAKQTKRTPGHLISHFIMARTCTKVFFFSGRPVQCLLLTPGHRIRPFLWYQEHRTEQIANGSQCYLRMRVAFVCLDILDVYTYRESYEHETNPPNHGNKGLVWKWQSSCLGKYQAC